MLDIVFVWAAVMVYHEIAHLYVAGRYDAFLGIVLFSGSGWRRVLTGPGVAVDPNALTARQRRTLSFAPLAYLPVAAVAYGVYTYTGAGLAALAAIIFTVAGAMALFSDVPQELGWIDLASDNMDIYWMVDYRKVKKE